MTLGLTGDSFVYEAIAFSNFKFNEKSFDWDYALIDGEEH